jgi:hypothetical protein
MSQKPDVFSAFKEAVTGLIGGSLTWLLACSLAGVVATATAESRYGYPTHFEWEWGFAWIAHLAVAGIAFWGLLVMCVHVWCISELVHGTERPLRMIFIAFFVQLTTSSIMILTLEDDVFERIAVVWVACATVGISYFILSLLKQRREERA